jgi:hypothetical protein
MREDKDENGQMKFGAYIITFTQPYNYWQQAAKEQDVVANPEDICSYEAAKKAENAAAECIERWMHPKPF